MNNAEQTAMVMDAYHKIFASKAAGTDITQVAVTTDTGPFYGRWFVSGTLRGFDLTFMRGNKTIAVRFLEQNPFKPSEYGRRAANGANIMWCIELGTNKWLFRVEGNQIFLTDKPAFTPVQNTQNMSARTIVSEPIGVMEVEIESLPEINEPMPDAVIRAMTEGMGWEGEVNEDFLPDSDLYQ